MPNRMLDVPELEAWVPTELKNSERLKVQRSWQSRRVLLIVLGCAACLSYIFNSSGTILLSAWHRKSAQSRITCYDLHLVWYRYFYTISVDIKLETKVHISNSSPLTVQAFKSYYRLQFQLEGVYFVAAIYFAQVRVLKHVLQVQINVFPEACCSRRIDGVCFARRDGSTSVAGIWASISRAQAPPCAWGPGNFWKLNHLWGSSLLLFTIRVPSILTDITFILLRLEIR